jgi:anti-sigma B factor antagonist
MAANPLPGAPKTFAIDVQSSAGAPLLKCTGNLNDDGSAALKSEVKKLLPGSERIVLDLSGVNYMDSSGLGTLLATFISARSAGCELRLVNLSPRIQELLRLTRLANVFEGSGQ